MNRPIYRAKDNWVLCECVECSRLNYVGPHGTTAFCPKCRRDTEHKSICFSRRNFAGNRVIFTAKHAALKRVMAKLLGDAQ